VGCRSVTWRWNASLIEVGAERVFSVRPIILHVDEVSRRPGLLEAPGNHEGNRLAVARHFRPGEYGMRFAVITGALRGCVAMGENQCDARRFLRRPRVKRFDPSFSDRGLDHITIQHVVLLHLIGVARAAGDLQWAIHAVEWLADDALRIEGIRADG